MCIVLVLYVLWFFALRAFLLPFCASYPFNEVSLGLAQLNTPVEKLLFLLRHFRANFVRFFSLSGDIIEISQRYFITAISALLLVVAAVLYYKKKKLLFNPAFGMLVSLLGLCFMTFLLYDVFEWRDYRTLAPITFGAILWLVLYVDDSAFGRRTVAAAVVCEALLFILFLRNIPTWTGVADKQPTLSSFQWPETVTVEDGSCPSLTLYGIGLDITMAENIPPQMGIQGCIDEEMLATVKSEYILTANSVSSADLPDGYESLYAFPDGYGILYGRVD